MPTFTYRPGINIDGQQHNQQPAQVIDLEQRKALFSPQSVPPHHTVAMYLPTYISLQFVWRRRLLNKTADQINDLSDRCPALIRQGIADFRAC